MTSARSAQCMLTPWARRASHTHTPSGRESLSLSGVRLGRHTTVLWHVGVEQHYKRRDHASARLRGSFQRDSPRAAVSPLQRWWDYVERACAPAGGCIGRIPDADAVGGSTGLVAQWGVNRKRLAALFRCRASAEVDGDG